MQQCWCSTFEQPPSRFCVLVFSLTGLFQSRAEFGVLIFQSGTRTCFSNRAFCSWEVAAILRRLFFFLIGWRLALQFNILFCESTSSEEVVFGFVGVSVRQCVRGGVALFWFPILVFFLLIDPGSVKPIARNLRPSSTILPAIPVPYEVKAGSSAISRHTVTEFHRRQHS